MQGDTAAQPQPTGGAPASNQSSDPQWQYTPEDNEGPDQAPAAFTPQARDGQPALLETSWTASEFVAHSKGPGWYLIYASAAVAIIVLLYLLFKDWISVGAVFIMAVLFGILAGRKPRVLEYRLDRAGLTIGDRFYPYADFKSFSIIDDGAFPSITFVPLRRFMPPVTVYFDPADEDRIVDVLSLYLPFEERTHDAIDRLTRRIRF